MLSISLNKHRACALFVRTNTTASCLSVAASTAFGRHLSVHRPNAIQKRLMWGVPHTPVLFYKGV